MARSDGRGDQDNGPISTRVRPDADPDRDGKVTVDLAVTVERLAVGRPQADPASRGHEVDG
jgi:hypothetical protein